VIHLPFGRNPSKVQAYYQTVHGRPVAGGLISRTPREAYAYIDANPLLAAWRKKPTPVPKKILRKAKYRAAIKALQRDGFRYIVVHSTMPGTQPAVLRGWRPKEFVAYFAGIPPHYEDDQIQVWRIADIAARKARRRR
jgi:hypothetical protein